MKKKIFLPAILTSVLFVLFSIRAQSSAEEPTERYGRGTAFGNVAYAYDLIESGVMAEEPSERIEFDSKKALTLDELREAYALFASDFPECFWLGTNYSYALLESSDVIVAIEPHYAFAGEELTEAKSAMREAINAILEDMPTDSDYGKALYLHDALAENTEYKMVGEHQTAYGALVSKKAVCAGYAAAYHLLLQEAGISAWTVSGVSYDPSSNQEVPHAWNVVWLDGVCLYTDVTWDDQGDELYHAYFNLSLEEIEDDHIVNDDVFTLPDCNHYGKGYFHNNGYIITDSTTPKEAAKMFDTTKYGFRTAEVIYDGDSGFSAWIEENFEDLYFAIGGKPSPDARYATTTLGREIHILILGNLPIMTHRVTVELGENVTFTGSLQQEVTVKDSITAITVTANSDSYFPTTYNVFTAEGITVLRVSYTELRILGTPESSVTITLDSATKKQILKTPAAAFIATGADCGTLSGLNVGAKYSTDGGATWTEVDGPSAVIESGVGCERGILVINPGDNVTTLDSEIQSITVTEAELTYTAISHSETSAGGDGRISGLSPLMEYSSDGRNWTPCNSDEITELTPGDYFVRVMATGTALASESLLVTVPAYTDSSVKGVTVASLEIFLGDTENTVRFVINPEGAKNRTVYFTSDNPKVLSVDSLTGKLTPLSRGRATVTVTTQNGGFGASAEIRVSCRHSDISASDEPRPDCRSGEVYYECLLCGQIFDSQEHEIDQIPKTHLYSNVTKHDKEEHWNECSCGERTNVESHAFDDWKDFAEGDEKMQKRSCEVCGAEEIRKVPISEKILGFFKDNLLFFILGAAAIATAVTVILIVKKKMKN